MAFNSKNDFSKIKKLHLPKSKLMATASKKIFKTLFATMLIFGSLLVMVGGAAAESTPVPPWPSNIPWENYTIAGEPVTDYEDKPYENDPTHGIANVQPKAVDIASGVDASGGGAANNPGDYTSVQWHYWDEFDDTIGFSNIDDDWLFLRMRVAEDPRHGGKYYYKSYHWDILVDTDGDIWKEFVIDINGGGGVYQFGTVGVYYNDNETYEYEPDDDIIWAAEASKASNEYTRAVAIDYGPGYKGLTQYWVEYRIPVTGFKDKDNIQLLGKDTDFRLFFSTSASMTNPLQKDWMAEYVFATPPNITVEKSVAEAFVDPGDVIHYKIYYNNTGESNAGVTYINDTLSSYVTYLSSSLPYSYINGNVYTWKLDTVAPGNHTLYLNVTANKYILSGTEIINYVHLDYSDESGTPFPSSEDSVKSIVTAPEFTLTKISKEQTVYPGDIIHYEIEIINKASGSAAEVWVVDTIPTGTTYKESSINYYSMVGNEIGWYFTNVKPGKILIYLNVTASRSLKDGEILNNSVEMLFNDANGNLYPKLYAWAETTIITPIFTIDKQASQSTADPGDIIEFTIKYTNSGNGTASHVWINDTIPQYTKFLSSTPTYTSTSGNVYSWLFTDVAPGTYSIIMKMRVIVNTPDGTILKNVAILNYWAGPYYQYPQEEDSEEVTVTAPIINITKVADTIYADPGDVITYTISYENTGTGDGGHVWINDTIPGDTTFVSSNPSYTSVSGDTYTWHFTNVGTGSYSIILKVQVDIETPDKTILVNKVTLEYTDANGNQPYAQDSDSATVIVTSPIMTISKSADVSTADPGDVITYTITYINTGSGTAAHVWINDTISSYTTIVSATPNYDYLSGDTYTWHFTNVGTGTFYITLKVRVDVGTPDTTELVNMVTMEYSDENGNQPYDIESDYANVTTTAPIMTFTKVADVTTADPGDIITYTIEYKNTGTGVAAHVYVNDTIPADTTYVSSTPTYTSVSGDIYRWHFMDVKPGTYTIILKVRVDVGTADGAILVNKATMDYTDATGHPYSTQSDSATVIVTAPIMTITKEADVSTADPGDIITYTIEYKNTGTGVAAHVYVNDTIAADTTFVSSTPAYTSVSGDTFRWHFMDVKPGNYTITLKVRVDVGTADRAVLVNKATLDYTDATGHPYATQSDSAIVIVTAPIMTITKVADVNTADPSDIITYTIEYSNTGTGNAAHVYVNDTIAADTTYVSSTPSYTSLTGDTYRWHFLDVKPGTYKITLEVQVDIGTADGRILVNKVTLDYTDATGHPYTTQSDSATVTVTAPIMTISKSTDVNTSDPSDIITYKITYKNLGTGIAGKVVIEDTIPADTTYDSSTPAYTSASGDIFTWIFYNVTPGTYYITLNLRVDIGTPDETFLVNKVTLDYTDLNGNPYGQKIDFANVTVTAPIMSITKVADVSTADPGDVITYTIEYKNTGTGTAGMVWVKDTIPADTTYVSSTPTYTTVSGDIYTWYTTNLKPGTYKITLIVRVDVGTSDTTVLTNKVTLDYTDANGNSYKQESDSATVTVTAPIMTITKVADVSTADPGDVITYTITYKNTGTGNAAHVYVNDTIPADTTYVSSTPAYTSVSGDTFRWHFTDVKPGTYTITLKVRVDVGTADGAVLTNKVTLDYTDATGHPYSTEGDSATVTVTAPIMTITKTADVSNADPGDVITYTITYKNTGTGNAAHVYVNDTIAADTTYVSSTPAYTSVSGDTYRWHFTDVKPGTYTIILKVRVDVGTADGAVLTNNVTLDYTDATGHPYSTEGDSATVTTTAPIMTITKVTNVSTADPGDVITYTITYKNTGTGNAAHVYVNDTIAADTTYVSSTPAYTSVSGDTYRWHFTDVKPGTYTIILKVRVDVGTADGAVLTNKVTLDYTDATGHPYTSEGDSAAVTVTASIMTITKVADVTTADPGDVITYTITYKNTGTGNAAHVYINDTIAADTTYVSSTPAYTSVSGDTYRWHFTDVKPGTYTIILKVRVDVGTADGTILTNKVTLDYTDATGHPYSTQSDSVPVTVTAPIMSISKVADVTTADPGDVITYTITYKNTGTGNAAHVYVNDTIPADTTYVSSTPAYTSVSGDTFYWHFKDVKPDTYTIILKVRVDVGTADGAVLTNKVTLDYTDATGHPYTTKSDSVSVTVTAPIMTITKVADVSIADPGDVITYTITYKNTGTGNAAHVYINDTIAADTTYVSSTPAYTSVSGDTFYWHFTDVKPGTYTITLKVSNFNE
jgi:uncharacterized repeat protein (TIGR01451 family)